MYLSWEGQSQSTLVHWQRTHMTLRTVSLLTNVYRWPSRVQSWYTLTRVQSTTCSWEYNSSTIARVVQVLFTTVIGPETGAWKVWCNCKRSIKVQVPYQETTVLSLIALCSKLEQGACNLDHWRFSWLYPLWELRVPDSQKHKRRWEPVHEEGDSVHGQCCYPQALLYLRDC